ncbi:MAG: Hsp70 family protein [Gemmataceae bacterium]|nr:Hsp70 family protein [Gemmataceae bacterium]
MAQQSLHDIYRQYCLKFVLAGLHSVVGKPKNLVTDLAQYQNHVIYPTWNMLPLPIRLMGRPRLRWDEFFTHLRPEVFLAPEGKVALRADASQRLMQLVNRMFGGAGAAAAPAAAGPLPAAFPVAAPGAVPMAMPVQTAPLVAQPIMPTAPPAAAPARRTPAPAPSPPAAQRARTPAPPVESPDSDIALGIDLGTTYSVVAYLDAHGRPVSIPNATGEIVTPSVVLFDEAGPVVGKEAVQASAMEPEKVAECVKRDMGSKYYRKKVGGGYMPPEVISSIILKSLKDDAERKLGPIRKAVITVPAYFDESRRRSTIDAGRLAGLDVLDIINEPTSAAIAYGYQLGFLDPTGKSTVSKPLRVLVYDLGGGTFDVTIVEIQGTSFKAVATDGDVALGGKDWDDKLIEIAAEQFVTQHREDPRQNPVSLQEMWLAAETCKKTLTERPKAAMFVNHLGTRMKIDITREQFEDATAALLGRTRTTTEIVVRQASLNWSLIDRVLLVGGSTRMPQVARMLQELTGKPPERSVAVDEAVAHGAALYASLIVSKQKPTAASPKFSVTNINSHSLGIVGTDPTTGRKKNQILIPKNTPLPTAVTKVFKTQKPGQQTVVIRVVEGESERPEACIQVGTCTIGGLPPQLPAGSPVTVSYAYHADGRLEVTGQVKGLMQPVTTTFQRENTMDDTEMQMWSQYVSVAGAM